MMTRLFRLLLRKQKSLMILYYQMRMVFIIELPDMQNSYLMYLYNILITDRIHSFLPILHQCKG